MVNAQGAEPCRKAICTKTSESWRAVGLLQPRVKAELTGIYLHAKEGCCTVAVIRDFYPADDSRRCADGVTTNWVPDIITEIFKSPPFLDTNLPAHAADPPRAAEFRQSQCCHSGGQLTGKMHHSDRHTVPTPDPFILMVTSTLNLIRTIQKLN